MMSRRARFLLLAVLLLLAGLLAIFLASRLQPYTETIDLGPSPEARRNPYLAAELFLRKQGVTVSRADGLEVLKELPPSGHTLLLLGSRSGLTPGQARRLHHLVGLHLAEAGNVFRHRAGEQFDVLRQVADAGPGAPVHR